MPLEHNHVAAENAGAAIRVGGSWTLAQVVLRNLFMIISTIILARVLTPNDYGIMGAVTVLTGLIQTVADLGLSWAAIQRRNLAHQQVSDLFWLNCLFGLLLGTGCLALGSIAASYFNEAILRVLLPVVGLSFIFSGVAAQPMALMVRRMRYKAVTLVEMCALFVGTTSAILTAYIGLGFWALVLQVVITAAVRALSSLLAQPIRLVRPAFSPETRSLAAFGGGMVLVNLCIYVGRSADSALIGRHWGMFELGIYNRAYFLTLLPSQLVSGVFTSLMVPGLAAVRTDKQHYARLYRKALVLVVLVGCPIALGLALTADIAIQLVYGGQWIEAVPLVIALSIAGVSQPVFNTHGWLYTSDGKIRSFLVVSATNALVLGIAFALVVERGVLEVALAYGLIMGLVLTPLTFIHSHRAVGISPLASLRALLPVALALLGLAAGTLLAKKLGFVMGLSSIPSICIEIAAGAVSYATVLFLILDRDTFAEIDGLCRRVCRLHRK